MATTETIYTSVSCNRTANSLDWNGDNRICFAAKNSVLICEPGGTHEPWKVIKQIVPHTDRVNTCKWLASFIISGSDDKTVALSTVDGVSRILKGHESNVTLVDGIQLADESFLIASGADRIIKLWNGEGACLQTIDLGAKFCLGLKLCQFGGEVLLAYATDDCKISLCLREESGEFAVKLALTGHEDWVLSLDFCLFENSLFLASGSQDTFIRLWKIHKSPEAAPVDRLNVEREDRKFSIAGESFTVALESVLQGHEGWVTGVCWCHGTELRLLSASADRTLIVWTTNSDGVWTEKIRTGEVGGNTFGFFGAKFSPTGMGIVGHGYYGSLHQWNEDVENDRRWEPSIVVGGHFGPVVDIHWEPEGKYLISVSADQTTRVHAPWIKTGSWHEIARPQIHGYDMHCIAPLSRYRFASGAEEKIVRVFDAPFNFVENFKEISGVTDEFEGVSKGASRPTLGLSNKAVNENIETKDLRNGEYPDHYFVETKLTEPPVEETLLQNTLWPETHKLYGHEGYEIFSLAAGHYNNLLASACKAKSAEHAQVLLWDCTTWKVRQKLTAHQLTVTQMEFSPDDKYLLTVSRDRQWSLFADSDEGYTMTATSDKGAHARIIWCCSWSHDSTVFVTGSRDKKVIAWRTPEAQKIAVLDAKEDVTAISVLRRSFHNGYLVAVGLANGRIQLNTLLGEVWTKIHEFQGHHLTVRRLHFRPSTDDTIELASCGDDNFVKIHRIVTSFNNS